MAQRSGWAGRGMETWEIPRSSLWRWRGSHSVRCWRTRWCNPPNQSAQKQKRSTQEWMSSSLIIRILQRLKGDRFSVAAWVWPDSTSPRTLPSSPVRQQGASPIPGSLTFRVGWPRWYIKQKTLYIFEVLGDPIFFFKKVPSNQAECVKESWYAKKEATCFIPYLSQKQSKEFISKISDKYAKYQCSRWIKKANKC